MRGNSIMERWVQTCRRELLDRTLIWNQPHLLHVLGEFEQFYNGHRPHQGIANARPLQPLPVPLAARDQNAAFTYDDATDSAEYFMSTSMWHELHGWGFRQGQPWNGSAGTRTWWSAARPAPARHSCSKPSARPPSKPAATSPGSFWSNSAS